MTRQAVFLAFAVAWLLGVDLPSLGAGREIQVNVCAVDARSEHVPLGL